MLNVGIFVLLCVIWGSTWLAIKIGLEGSPPLLAAGFRFAVAALSIFLLTAIRRKFDFGFGRSWFFVIIAGLLTYPVSYSLVYIGTLHVDSGIASVLFATMPFFVAILAHLNLPNDKLTVLKVSGMTLGFAGIVMIFADHLSLGTNRDYWGMLAIVAASFFSSWGTIIFKKYLHHLNPLPLTAIQTLLGAVILISLGLATEQPSSFRIDPKTIGSLLYLGILGTAVAFSLYIYLLKKMDATRISTIAFITPVVALFLGIIYRREVFNPLSISGSFLVVLGVMVVVTGDNIWNNIRRSKILESKP